MPESEKKPETIEKLYDLADFFKVFADTTRVRILYCLVDGAFSVQEIADCLDMTQSAISHQLRILKTSRLVKAERSGKQMFYSLCDEHVSTIINMGLEHIEEL